MIKKIKQYFSLQKRIKVEILETLCSICLYLRHDGRYGHNPYSRHMDSHFVELKTLSQELRKTLIEEENQCSMSKELL